MLLLCPLCSYQVLFQIIHHILNKHITKKSIWAYILRGLEKMQEKVIYFSNDWQSNVLLACFASNPKNSGEKRTRNMPYTCPAGFLLLDITSILKACNNVSKKSVPCILGVEEYLQYQGKVQDSCFAELNAA